MLYQLISRLGAGGALLLGLLTGPASHAQLPAGAAAATTPVPRVASGSIRRFAAFKSQFVAARTVDVWLPAGYPGAGRYDVLYLHDGQMLFDSTTTWNHQEWRVDKTLGRLIQAQAVRPTIVVGIWNNGPLRHTEYFPQKPLASLPAAVRERLLAGDLHGQARADDYLRFLTQELKPFIDRMFATRPTAAHTFVAGSSMGGLISLYALCEYPQVFGGAACLSTHWPGSVGPDQDAIAAAFVDYLRQHLPAPAGHRLYFDHGSATLDSLYAPYQQRADAVLRARGYTPATWTTRTFAGANHSEQAWAQRLALPLQFVLGRPAAGAAK